MFSLGGQFLDLGLVLPQSPMHAHIVHHSSDQGDAVVRRSFQTNENRIKYNNLVQGFETLIFYRVLSERLGGV